MDVSPKFGRETISRKAESGQVGQDGAVLPVVQLEVEPYALAGQTLHDGEDEVVEGRGRVTAVHAPNVHGKARVDGLPHPDVSGDPPNVLPLHPAEVANDHDAVLPKVRILQHRLEQVPDGLQLLLDGVLVEPPAAGGEEEDGPAGGVRHRDQLDDLPPCHGHGILLEGPGERHGPEGLVGTEQVEPAPPVLGQSPAGLPGIPVGVLEKDQLALRPDLAGTDLHGPVVRRRFDAGQPGHFVVEVGDRRREVGPGQGVLAEDARAGEETREATQIGLDLGNVVHAQRRQLPPLVLFGEAGDVLDRVVVSVVVLVVVVVIVLGIVLVFDVVVPPVNSFFPADFGGRAGCGCGCGGRHISSY